MNLLFKNNMMLIASLGVLFLLLVNQNVFCDEEPPEDPLPPSNMTLRFSPFHLTNSFAGVIETTPNIQGNWINISTNDSCINVCANSTNITQNARGLVNCSFQLGSTNENCHTSVNLTLTCLWDETADDRGEDEYLVTFCKKLSFEDEVSGTILPTFNDTVHDSDVYYFESNGKSGFCFEVDSADELDYKVSFDDGDWKNINKVQMLNKHGNEIPKNYRLYVTNELNGVQYSFFMVKRKSGSSNNEISYNVKLRKVRPLLLVHGIKSFPREPSDNYHGKDIAFQDVYDHISSSDDFKPTIPFPFPWNSKEGVYYDYCSGTKSLKDFAELKCNNWYRNPVILAHSMGGLLSIRQISSESNFANNIDGIVCLGSPFTGSDLGNFAVLTGNAPKTINGTSHENCIHLSRGSTFVWERMISLPDKIKSYNRSTFFGGVAQNSWAALSLKTGIGDGIVSMCSANLANTMEWSGLRFDFIKVSHFDMHTFKIFNTKTCHQKIYNEVKVLVD